MAKSSFLGSLAKGFVRSAVNQVGRDSGKVVSNSMYGDRHSTPVRHVNGTGGNSGAAGGQANGVYTDVIERQNVEVGSGVIIIYIIASCIFPIIGPGLLIINGLKRIFRKRVTIKRLISEEVYVPDESSPDGKRHAGHQQYVKKEKVPSTEHDLSVDRKTGVIYLIAGIIILAIDIIAFMNMSDAGVGSAAIDIDPSTAVPE